MKYAILLIRKIQFNGILQRKCCCSDINKKEYLCTEVRTKLMNSSLSKPHTYDDNEEDIASNCNSIHDTDTSNSDYGDDKKYHVVQLYHKTYEDV